MDRDAAPLSDAELLASALDRQAQVNPAALAG
jgi:hypothetical protein